MALGGGGGGSAKAIEAGRAFVRITADDSALVKGLQAASRRLQSFGAGIRKLGFGLFGAGLSVLGPLGAAFSEMVEHFSTLQDMSDRLGATAEAISTLGYAADQSGSSLEEMEVAAKFLQKAIASNDPGLAKLGLSAERLKGLGLDEQFQAVADVINEMDDPTERTAAALDLFGKAGYRMLPMLKDLRELRGRAGLVGDMVSSEDVSKAEQFGDLFNDIRKSIKNTTREVAQALLGGLDTFRLYVDRWLGVLKAAREWVRANRQVVVTVALVAAGVTALGAALIAVGTAISLAGVALGALGSALAVIFSPAGIAVAGIGLAGYAILRATGYTEEFGKAVVSSFSSIANAISAGRLDLAWKVVTATLTVEWRRFTNTLSSTFEEAWHDVSFVVKNLWNDLTTALLKKTIDLAKATRDAFGAGATGGGFQGLGAFFEKWSDMLAGQKTFFNVRGYLKALGVGLDVLGKQTEELSTPEGAAAAKAALDKANAEKAAELNKQFAADKEKREAARKAALAAAEAELAKAQAEANKARPPAGKDFADRVVDEAIKRRGGLGGLEFGGAAGAFQSGDFRQLLGGSAETGKKQLNVLEDIRDEIKKGGVFV